MKIEFHPVIAFGRRTFGSLRPFHNIRPRAMVKLNEFQSSMDCIFCKIVAKEIPAYAVYEDDLAFAFLDINPLAAGHTVVIPKSHAVTLLDLPDANIGPLFAAVKAVTAKLEKTLQSDGFTIGINHGDAAGQSVKHLHIHIIPRWKTDGGRSLHSVVDNPPGETVEVIARRVTGS